MEKLQNKGETCPWKDEVTKKKSYNENADIIYTEIVGKQEFSRYLTILYPIKFVCRNLDPQISQIVRSLWQLRKIFCSLHALGIKYLLIKANPNSKVLTVMAKNNRALTNKHYG